MMNFVEPIRNPKKIAQIKNTLIGAGRWRDLLLFTFGVNTALRASDLLALQVGAVAQADGERLVRFVVREQKTGKRHDVTVNESMTSALDLFLGHYPTIIEQPENYLFFDLRPPLDFTRPIDRRHAWTLVSDMCHEAGLVGNYGAHTLRKTWGYHARLNGVDLGLIMRKLNHSSFQETMRYLGITDDELQAAVLRLNL